jgi:hypothetical protein
MQTETAVETVPEATCSCCGTPYPDTELVHLGCHPEIGICHGCVEWLGGRSGRLHRAGRRPSRWRRFLGRRSLRKVPAPSEFVTIPILPSPDFDETMGFYSTLGFAERSRWPDTYLTISDDRGIELHFWSNDGVDPKTNDVACYVRFTSERVARALHDEWAGLDLAPGRLHPPRATDYGLLEFALVDPHGNLVRIGGNLDGTP